MASIFTRIIQGEIPCHRIFEDEETIAFLDINPIQPGMTLVVPKKEIDSLYDLEEDLYTKVFLTVKKIAPAIQKATNAPRIGIVVEGFEIPHAHVKLIPIASGHDLNPEHAKETSPEELAAMAEKIKSFL